MPQAVISPPVDMLKEKAESEGDKALKTPELFPAEDSIDDEITDAYLTGWRLRAVIVS
jgi:hypothetical protein